MDRLATGLAGGHIATLASDHSPRRKALKEPGWKNIFVDGESIRYSGGFGTPVRDGAEIYILPAVSGG